MGDSIRQEANVTEPLIPKNEMSTLQPRAIGVASLGGHRRNRSADFRSEEFDETRKHSVGDLGLMESESNSKSRSGTTESEGVPTPEKDKKKLSVSRGVNLPRIQMRPVAVPHERIEPIPKDTASAMSTPISNVLKLTGAPDLCHRPGEVLPIRIYINELVVDDECEHDDEDESCVSGVQFAVEDGRSASADFLLQLMAGEYGIEKEMARDAFALWMVSPLLALQLKPHHKPYEVGRGWSTVVSRFCGNVDRLVLEQDEPVLFFRRSVQLSAEREFEITTFCTNTLKLLFMDAKAVLFQEEYPLDLQIAAELAGIGFAIDLGPYNPKLHTVEFIRRELDTQLPTVLADQIRGSLVFGKAISSVKNLESVLLKSWQSVSRDAATEDRYEVKRQYLHVLRSNSSCYGCAFFSGFIEKPSISPLKSIRKFFQSVAHGAHEVPIRIAISRDRISVFDKAHSELLLVQNINECTWRRIDCSTEQIQDGQQPILLLNFPSEDSRNEFGRSRTLSSSSSGSSNLLQIFGCQASLMDTLLTAMDVLHREDTHDSDYESEGGVMSDNSLKAATLAVSDTSGPPSANSTRSAVSRTPSLSKDNKMCLASFKDGRCVKATGSLKKVDWRNMQSVH